MKRLANTVLLMTAAGLAHAAPQIEPGLWEQSHRMKSESGKLERAAEEMRQQFESLPAAQREMMEQMLEQQGVVLGLDQTVRRCVTEEEARQGILELMDLAEDEEGCTQTATERGNTLVFDYACTGATQDRGRGEITFHSTRHYSGRFDLETEMEGQPERMQITHEGKWLGKDCGKYAP